MDLGGRSHNDLAAGTLADFERTGDGCYLDNADADVLRAMVRLSVNHHRGAVSDVDTRWDIEWLLGYAARARGETVAETRAAMLARPGRRGQ